MIKLLDETKNSMFALYQILLSNHHKFLLFHKRLWKARNSVAHPLDASLFDPKISYPTRSEVIEMMNFLLKKRTVVSPEGDKKWMKQFIEFFVSASTHAGYSEKHKHRF